MSGFDNFKPGPDPTTASQLLIQGFETTRVVNDPDTFLTIKVSDRILLSVEFDNMKQHEMDQWCSGFNSKKCPMPPVPRRTFPW